MHVDLQPRGWGAEFTPTGIGDSRQSIHLLEILVSDLLVDRARRATWKHVSGRAQPLNQLQGSILSHKLLQF